MKFLKNIERIMSILDELFDVMIEVQALLKELRDERRQGGTDV